MARRESWKQEEIGMYLCAKSRRHCHREYAEGPSLQSLIDVDDRRVVSGHSDRQYVAVEWRAFTVAGSPGRSTNSLGPTSSVAGCQS